MKLKYVTVPPPDVVSICCVNYFHGFCMKLNHDMSDKRRVGPSNALEKDNPISDTFDRKTRANRPITIKNDSVCKCKTFDKSAKLRGLNSTPSCHFI